MDTLKEIEKYLAEYFTKGNTMTILELIENQDKLSIHSYRLAEKAADSKSDYNGCYFMRKVNVNRSTQSLIGKGLSKAAATVEAETEKENVDLVKAELEAEAEAYKYDLLLGQVNRVLSAMQQRISYLKH